MSVLMLLYTVVHRHTSLRSPMIMTGTLPAPAVVLDLQKYAFPLAETDEVTRNRPWYAKRSDNQCRDLQVVHLPHA